MIYKAYASDTTKLLSLPESGMGYQVIQGKLYGSQVIHRFVVYNCELVVDLDNDFAVNKRTIVEKNYKSILGEAKLWSVVTNSIQLALRKDTFETRYLNADLQRIKKRHSGGKGATENPKENADGKEGFVRISAYENDLRIDFEKKRLKDGSFTTTHLDYLDCLHCDDNPIDRYALPTEEKIKWAFSIQPKSIDILQRGIVQPANGHYGGGIEAYFEHGTSENTFFATRPYGQ